MLRRMKKSLVKRASELKAIGFGAYDALHLACAEHSNADDFLTTDDKLLRLSHECSSMLKVKVDNPLMWLKEVIENVDTSSVVTVTERSFTKGEGVIGVVGAGNFTSATLLPALKPLDAQLKYIVSAGGQSAGTLARRAGVACAATDYRQALKDDEVDLLIITTRHNLHASMVIESLEAGKSVFVEKPPLLKSGGTSKDNISRR